LTEVTFLFLKLGFTAFGGPAAHIAIMHDEIVARRKWLTEQEFLDLLGATNLIPGPNSTEMAIHVSFLRAGWPGLILGGACFILPAMAMVMGFAWAYVRFGTTPEVTALLAAVQPVVIVIISQALWLLGRKAVKDWLTVVVALATFGLALLRVNELLLLAAGGVLGMVIYNWRRRTALPAIVLAPLAVPGLVAAAAAVPFTLTTLFWTFLKIGSVLYGSGYVLIAFLRADFVERLGWLTEKQLLDAVAVGQVTPGPLFTTATFIGYVLGGIPGGVLATVGIFLPAFIFVAATSRLIPRLRASPWAAGFLDSVNAAALGLMAAVTVQLAYGSFGSPVAIAIAVVAAVLLFRFKVNSMWLVAGAAATGLIVGFITA
jgi:chromate transporter